MTKLDEAHAAMTGGDEAAGLGFYRELADATLFVVLEREAEAEVVVPRVFDLDNARVILAFDNEERLAGLGEDPVPYAALPGRIVAQQMRGQGLSLGLNLGSGAASETLLPPEALDWLVQMLGVEPASLQAQAEAFRSPEAVPQALLAALQRVAVAASGLAEVGLLAAVRYQGGRQGHIFAFVNAGAAAEAALTRSVAEALAFSGLDAGELDVTFLGENDPALARLSRVARVFEVPQRVATEPTAPAAPGMDPAAPPRLR